MYLYPLVVWCIFPNTVTQCSPLLLPGQIHWYIATIHQNYHFVILFKANIFQTLRNAFCR